jgi:hypothetical protein
MKVLYPKASLNAFCQVCFELQKHFPLLCETLHLTPSRYEYLISEKRSFYNVVFVQNYLIKSNLSVPMAPPSSSLFIGVPGSVLKDRAASPFLMLKT